MQPKTKEIISKIRQLRTEKEITDFVESCHYELKGKLIITGIKFYDENSSLSQDIIERQSFNGAEMVELAKSYEEVNYIRKGLTKEWTFNSHDKERFEEIKNAVDKTPPPLKH